MLKGMKPIGHGVPQFPYPIKDGSEKNVSESAVPLARLRTEAPEHRRVTPKLKDIV